MSNSKNELELIKSAQDGNEDAWYCLISKYSKTVWFVISKYNYKLDEKEDIYQEIFIRLVRSIKNYQPEISTFIIAISKRTCIDRLRKDKPFPIV